MMAFNLSEPTRPLIDMSSDQATGGNRVQAMGQVQWSGICQLLRGNAIHVFHTFIL